MQQQLHPVRCSAVVYWERSLVIIKTNTPQLAFLPRSVPVQPSDYKKAFRLSEQLLIPANWRKCANWQMSCKLLRGWRVGPPWSLRREPRCFFTNSRRMRNKSDALEGVGKVAVPDCIKVRPIIRQCPAQGLNRVDHRGCMNVTYWDAVLK